MIERSLNTKEVIHSQWHKEKETRADRKSVIARDNSQAAAEAIAVHAAAAATRAAAAVRKQPAEAVSLTAANIWPRSVARVGKNN